MKAVYQEHYGGPESLIISEIPIPEISSKQILVKVHATTLNRTDCALISGNPMIMRLFAGLFSPKRKTPGTDFAGVVVKVGSEVTKFQIGDKVVGFDDMGLSSIAEFMAISESKPIVKIPEGTSFQHAAASVEGAHYAINFLNKIDITSSSKVLVHGASGAIGSAMVQLLKSKGCYIVATCFANASAKVASLGANRMIELDTTDFTNDSEKFDFVLDAVGKSTFGECKKLLKPKGIYISSELGPWSQNIFLAMFTPLGKGRCVVFPIPSDIPATLDILLEHWKTTSFTPMIDRTYSIEQTPEAYAYVRSGKKIGNVVITME